MDQAVVADIVAGQRPWRVSLRRGRRLGPVLLISLWLHLTLLLLCLVTVRFERPEEELPPPSTVAMVFEGGQPQGPAVPKQQLLVPAPTSPPASPPAPPTPPRATAEAPPLPPTPPAPAPQAPTPVPAVPAPAAPPPVPQPGPQANTEVPPPPAPSPPAPTELPLPPPPPPKLAMVVPRPVLPTPRPEQRPTAPPRPERQPAFPAPMNFSFNAAPALTRPQPRTSSRGAPATMDFSLAPRVGATDNTPFSLVAGAHVGPDWRNQLSSWVRAHAYYPPQAVMNGEDGTAMVQVVANPDGRVTSVELESKSGSMWLDLALQALFRDAHLPPLQGETEPITFDFTMHYILIREP